MINWISDGDVCCVGSHIGRVWNREDSISDKLAGSIISGWGVNLVSRSKANRFALSKLVAVKVLSG